MGQGKVSSLRYSDILKKDDKPEEERTPDEIKRNIKGSINEIIRKGGKKQNGLDESGGHTFA